MMDHWTSSTKYQSCWLFYEVRFIKSRTLFTLVFIQCFVNPKSFGWYVHWVLVGMFSEFCFTRRGQKWSRNISFASCALPWHCWLWPHFLRSCSFQSVSRKGLVFEEVCVSDVSTFELGHRRYTESLTFWCLVQEQRWILSSMFAYCSPTSSEGVFV